MVQAVIQKYPNPHSKSARVSDIISRHVNSHGHVVTERYSGNKESGAYSSKNDLLGLRGLLRGLTLVLGGYSC